MAFQGDSIYWVEVEKIVPNPFQPRREFDEHKLKELADSVRMYGILQPLTVTRNEVQRDDGTFYSEYELIAGERRLRASKLAGLTQVPVIIRDGEQSEQEKLELAIIENLQREDLNAVDRALAFRQLADMFALSHLQVAQKVGRSREYVSNTIRLLALPEHILTSLRQGEMSEGHARTLLMLTDKPQEQEVVFREILLKKLSVREVERIARRIATDRVRKRDFLEADADIIEMEKQFMETLGTRVHIQKTDFGGKLTIDYFNVSDLEDMLRRIRLESELASQKADAEHLTAHTGVAMGAAPVVAEVVAETIAVPEQQVPSDVVDSESLSTIYQHESEEVMEVTESAALIDATPDSVAASEAPQVSEPTEESEVVEESFEVAEAEEIEVPIVVVQSATTEDEGVAETAAAEEVSPAVDMAMASESEPVFVAPIAPIAPPETDESDLYSIRHFSV